MAAAPVATPDNGGESILLTANPTPVAPPLMPLAISSWSVGAYP